MTGDALARLIERTRLIDALAAAPVGLIEAGSGYGKSVLAAQYRQKCGIATAYVPIGRLDRDVSVFASSVRRALRDARLSDMVAAVEGLEPEASADRLLDALADTEEAVLVIVDDAHELQDSDSSQLLMRLARGLSAPHRLLVAARSFHGELESLWNVQPAVHITAAELAFTLEEANQLVTLLSGRPAREHDVRMLVEATHGWATALSVTTGAWIRADRSVVWLASDPVAAPLRTLLDRLPAADQNALISLAHLPRLSPQITDSVAGEGAFERLVAAGLPLLRAGSGWWEFPGPVSDHLAGQGPIDPAAARLAADDYRRGGDELAAVRTLVAAGEFDDAAAVLGGLAPHRVELLGLGVVEPACAAARRATGGDRPPDGAPRRGAREGARARIDRRRDDAPA
jgi:ATP/maltotriose-dependent transcriptional regulator MalT